jgi:septal ring factor EnvC (AmiA/AmiB activator)
MSTTSQVDARCHTCTTYAPGKEQYRQMMRDRMEREGETAKMREELEKVQAAHHEMRAQNGDLHYEIQRLSHNEAQYKEATRLLEQALERLRSMHH